MNTFQKQNNHDDSYVVVRASSLRPVNEQLNLASYIREVKKRRHFIERQALGKAFSAGKGKLLGQLWLVLDPIFQVLVYLLIFGVIIKTSRGIDNFLGYLVVGVVFFGFFARGINSSTSVLPSNSRLILSFNFPKATLVISNWLRQVFDSVLPAAIALIIAGVTGFPKSFHLSLLLIVPLFVLMHIFILGVEFSVARLATLFPDTISLINLGVRGLFFLSGIFYSIRRFDDHLLLRDIMEQNPIYRFLQAFRAVSVYGNIPTIREWLILFAWSIGALCLGFIYFYRAEAKYVDSL